MALNLELNESRFIDLLTKLIGESKHVQNKPPLHIPEESLIGDHVLALLDPYLVENGGPLIVERLEYHERRNNILITYPGTGDKYVSFVGSHMDVVTADPANWERDPFSLTIEGDMLYGRGTTDCLGHVAMITDLFCQLGEIKPQLSRSVAALFIASEENGDIPGVGVDAVVADGKLEALKAGPLFWVDSADEQPCIGTGGSSTWELTVIGKNGHSGFPQNCINPLITASEVVRVIVQRFYEDFPAHEKEELYGFGGPSSFKPTLWECPPGSQNQIQERATIKGDIRVTPFYDLNVVRETITKYVEEIANDLDSLYTGCHLFKHSLEDGSRAQIQLTWGEGSKGIASNLEGEGYKAICQATEEVRGDCKPFSVTGTLPLVGDLQDEGFDIIAVGYGVLKAYHAKNEYATLSGMKTGLRVLSRIIEILNE